MLLRWTLLAMLCSALAAGASAAAAEPVALTFDDLPALSLTRDLAYQQDLTLRLLQGLRRNRLPAIGFVTESKLDGDDKAQRIALLAEWLDWGMDLGNHGYSHEGLTKTPLGDYIEDVAKGETVTRPLTAEHGRALKWYRHPYLETGATRQARQGFEDWLAAHGYRVAPVTLENSDWMFAYPYEDAIQRGDQAEAARVKRVYLDYTAKTIAWYRAAALQLLGRRPALVFLLHASRLNADCIDDLAAILRADHLQAVTLDQAMRDPAYRIPDTYIGPNGDEWLTRWSLTLHRELPWSSYSEPPADIAAANDRLDTSP